MEVDEVIRFRDEFLAHHTRLRDLVSSTATPAAAAAAAASDDSNIAIDRYRDLINEMTQSIGRLSQSIEETQLLNNRRHAKNPCRKGQQQQDSTEDSPRRSSAWTTSNSSQNEEEGTLDGLLDPRSSSEMIMDSEEAHMHNPAVDVPCEVILSEGKFDPIEGEGESEDANLEATSDMVDLKRRRRRSKREYRTSESYQDEFEREAENWIATGPRRTFDEKGHMKMLTIEQKLDMFTFYLRWQKKVTMKRIKDVVKLKYETKQLERYMEQIKKGKIQRKSGSGRPPKAREKMTEMLEYARGHLGEIGVTMLANKFGLTKTAVSRALRSNGIRVMTSQQRRIIRLTAEGKPYVPWKDSEFGRYMTAQKANKAKLKAAGDLRDGRSARHKDPDWVTVKELANIPDHIKCADFVPNQNKNKSGVKGPPPPTVLFTPSYWFEEDKSGGDRLKPRQTRQKRPKSSEGAPSKGPIRGRKTSDRIGSEPSLDPTNNDDYQQPREEDQHQEDEGEQQSAIPKEIAVTLFPGSAYGAQVHPAVAAGTATSAASSAQIDNNLAHSSWSPQVTFDPTLMIASHGNYGQLNFAAAAAAQNNYAAAVGGGGGGGQSQSLSHHHHHNSHSHPHHNQRSII